MIRIFLILIAVASVQLCLKSQNSTAPIAGQNLRVYVEAHASLSKLALRYTPPDQFDVNPWVFRPAPGIAIGVEYPLKNARWIPAFNLGYQVHDTKQDSYRSWGLTQSGYNLNIGINRQVSRKIKFGLYGWYMSIQQEKTRDRVSPFDFSFFDDNWAGLSYKLDYRLSHKIAIIYSFWHGRKIAETESYRINGTVYKTTQYRPIWMNLGGRFIFYQ